MVIEFCCPECEATLSVDQKSAGGQVACPKCSKKIFIPLRAPLETVDDKSAFDRSLMRSSAEVKAAISASIEPYRRELGNKVKLLADAVEMVKVRNQRIRDIETLMLGVQKDLWAIEVEYDDRNHAFKRAQAERRELREKLQVQTERNEQHAADEKEKVDRSLYEEEKSRQEAASKRAEELERTYEEYAARVEELERKQEEELKRIERMREERDQAQEKLQETQALLEESEDSLSLRNEQLSEAFENLEVLPILSDFAAHLVSDYMRQEEIVASRGATIDEAQALFEQVGTTLEAAEGKIRGLRTSITELRKERDAQEALATQHREAYEARETMLQEQQRQLDEQKSHFDSVVDGKGETEKELQSLRSRLNRTQNELLSKEKRMQDALSAQQEQLERVIKLEKVRTEQESMLQAETQRADAAQRKIERTQQSLEDLQRDHETSVETLEKERADLAAKLEKSKTKASDAKKQLTTLQKDFEHLKKSLASQPDQLETMNPSLPGMGGGSDEVGALLEASKSEIIDLRGQVRMLEDKVKAGENLRAHEKTMTERLRELELEHQAARESARKAEEELKNTRKEVETLSGQLNKAKKSSSKDLSQLSNGDAAMADLLKELESAREQIEAFDDVKWELERNAKEAQNENQRLQNTVKTLSANLKAQWKRGVPTR